MNLTIYNNIPILQKRAASPVEPEDDRRYHSFADRCCSLNSA
jgi:hypothetical protein